MIRDNVAFKNIQRSKIVLDVTLKQEKLLRKVIEQWEDENLNPKNGGYYGYNEDESSAIGAMMNQLRNKLAR